MTDNGEPRRDGGAQLLWVPTEPELVVTVNPSQHAALDAPFLPTEPPDIPQSSRARCITPTLGLSERPERRIVRDRAVLVSVDGSMSGAIYSLTKSGFTVGRKPDASLCIDEVGVSREHARLYFHDGTWWLEDLDSRNGTYLDGHATRLTAIHDGALVRFGPAVTFSFQLMDERHEAAVRDLFEKSHHDPLTHIHNRRYLDNRLRMELAFAMRHETQLSLVLLDIDHFKRINDAHGHRAGDEVLRQFARAIQRQLRTEDVFARYGGEEFAILLRDIGLAGAGVVAERARRRIEDRPLRLEGELVKATLSAGCSSLNECDPPTADELVAVADARLYSAKRSGRNRVVSS